MRFGQPIGNSCAVFLVGLAAPSHGPDRKQQSHVIKGLVGAGRPDDIVGVFGFVHFERPEDRGAQAGDTAMLCNQPAQPGALANEPGHEFLERLLLGVDRDFGDGRTLRAFLSVLGAGQHLLARLLQHLGGGAFVEHLEVRRNPRLEREAAQKRLAESRDGQDLHAARRVQDPREELPGARAHDGIGRIVEQLGQVFGQLLLVHGRPARQAVGQPVRHLRRRSLGEGQAEDACRRRTVQHQAQHPVGQHLGFAGPRRGGNPD